MTPPNATRSNSALRFLLLVVAVLAASVSVALAAIATRGLTSVLEITHAGTSPLVLPSDVAIGVDGRIYVVDGGNHRVAVFDRGGRHLTTFGGFGTEAGKLRDPVGIGVGPEGRVYVADKGNHRIQVFAPDGSLVRSFTVVQRGHPVAPVDVAVDAAGKTLYITGNNNHRVMAYTPEGKPVRDWGGEGTGRGQFRYPATLAVNPSGTVLVVDVFNTRVQAFDSTGRVYEAGAWGVLPGQLVRPKGIALDRAGRIFVSDSYLEVIQVFDSSYQFQYVLGHGGKPYKFTSPGGIALDGNRLYVAEMLKNRVSVFDLAP